MAKQNNNFVMQPGIGNAFAANSPTPSAVPVMNIRAITFTQLF
jgi:hypothetical protein